MAKITTTKYVCDICGKEVASENKLYKKDIPSRSYDCEGRNWKLTFTNLELCESCIRTLWKVCDKHFATVEDGYTVKAYPHFDTKEKENG